MKRKIDHVRFRDDVKGEDMVGYSEALHVNGWAVWKWPDEAVYIPSDRILDITTHEE